MNARFQSFKTLSHPYEQYSYYALNSLERFSNHRLSSLPYAFRPWLEGILRHHEQGEATAEDVLNLFEWQPYAATRPEVPFFPGRLLLQDFSGVPVLNDLTGMRAALRRMHGDPARLQPVIPVDLVIDHSVQVDYAGTPDAFEKNLALEYERNKERYIFLRWCQQAYKNLRIIPPATGIIHQVNLEYLSQVVLCQEQHGRLILYPDTVLGTDSHTTMTNGLGIAGWGIGGLEAVTAMLGQPVQMVIPDVIGVELSGQLRPGITPTDLTLQIVSRLRKIGVVDKVIEFFGKGLSAIPVADRAMIANMTPESGATMSFFPIDNLTLDYLAATGRSPEQIEQVRVYALAQQMFYDANTTTPAYSQVIQLNLDEMIPGVAGPRRPQDFIPLAEMPLSYSQSLESVNSAKTQPSPTIIASENLPTEGQDTSGLQDGLVAIAAITSCTNTSNPTVMLAAGLLAKKAVEQGLKVPGYTKTSLTPGSRVVAALLEAAGLLEPLEQLGFHIAAFGCATCIGNTGQLKEPVVEAVQKQGLIAAAVLSGNRNYEGRISPHTTLNYLASPPLVIAFALAGTVNLDITQDPLGYNPQGKPVYLKDIYPSPAEIEEALRQALKPEFFQTRYANALNGDDHWKQLPQLHGQIYGWRSDSTYLREPPFFRNIETQSPEDLHIRSARVLAYFGDSITTDHISPAGNIPTTSAAARYLAWDNVTPGELNSYGARRGNHEVLMRATFSNPRIKNLLLPGVEGNRTIFLPEKKKMDIFLAANLYQDMGIPLIVIAGKEYGTGSSRDWAAKGPALLGVKAVLAVSFERIHRSNLACMGILPLEFMPGESASHYEIHGDEKFDIPALPDDFTPRATIHVSMERPNGTTTQIPMVVRLDTGTEINAYRHHGILNALLFDMLNRLPEMEDSPAVAMKKKAQLSKHLL